MDERGVVFRIVCSTTDGAARAGELLDEENSWKALMRLRSDQAQDLRVGFEVGMSRARVYWKKPVQHALDLAGIHGETRERVEHLVALAVAGGRFTR